ncbi:Hypothetical protein NTJ_01111 [Nesidiocoris tenuis]|uniref:Uncharacterized protein n=1 Tax=Nesidiocoris tenuis TaxID=355587 RepID=A0ABN7ABW0_9HEMI|nr:Hypothetical protein NTJ_01111 [Nesidiocoris tenuis]
MRNYRTCYWLRTVRLPAAIPARSSPFPVLATLVFSSRLAIPSLVLIAHRHAFPSLLSCSFSSRFVRGSKLGEFGTLLDFHLSFFLEKNSSLKPPAQPSRLLWTLDLWMLIAVDAEEFDGQQTKS